ncbi:hypothetical protein VSR69_11490 [Paraburkholderia phytofirmans]|uniref:hypothetical protein n=1 Tax=Paraburkholderia sp. BL9I2N2 TaxID=1938809 RepID=UPI001FB37989|nr:hypothetical protein [Paraburkholderia sp. BL9I2N2]
MPVAEPAFARTEATPELPDVELKVTETFTPDWQLRPRENGVFAATEPAVGNIAGLIVARGSDHRFAVSIAHPHANPRDVRWINPRHAGHRCSAPWASDYRFVEQRTQGTLSNDGESLSRTGNHIANGS